MNLVALAIQDMPCEEDDEDGGEDLQGEEEHGADAAAHAIEGLTVSSRIVSHGRTGKRCTVLGGDGGGGLGLWQPHGAWPYHYSLEPDK